MQIWQQAHGYQRGFGRPVAEDRPLLRSLSDGGVRLELSGPDALWVVELTSEDCERIADEIGRTPPNEWPSESED